MKIYRDLIQDLLPHIHNLLEQLGFQEDGPVASDHTEAVQGVMILDRRHEAVIIDPYYGLPEAFD